MFVQIIEGTTTDEASLRRQLDRWVHELRPGAEGFLGATVGVTADGRVVDVACFESEALARANSERAEQGQWWAEMEKCFDGEVTFTESSDVDVLGGGASTQARFVQVMESHDVDRERMRAFDEALDPYLDRRPDILGGLRVWTGPDRCTEVIYFTNEQDARRGEAEAPPEAQEAFAEFADLVVDVEYLDLTDPIVI